MRPGRYNFEMMIRMVLIAGTSAVPAFLDAAPEGDPKKRHAKEAHGTKVFSETALLERIAKERAAIARERREIEELYKRIVKDREHSRRDDDREHKRTEAKLRETEAALAATREKLALSNAEAETLAKSLADSENKIAAIMKRMLLLEGEESKREAESRVREKATGLAETVASLRLEAEATKEELNGFKNLEKRWAGERAKLANSIRERDAEIEKLSNALASAKREATHAEEIANRARANLVEEKVERKRLELKKTKQLPTIEPVQHTKGGGAALEDYTRVLKDVAEALKAFPKAKIHIVGHTCSSGSHAANLQLSAKRAKNLATFLTTAGIPAEKISYEGLGETAPINDNSTEELRTKNRRVEIWITN